MKEEASMQKFPLSLPQRILLFVVLIVSAIGIICWAGNLWTYWLDASVFSAYLFFQVAVSVVIFCVSTVFLIRYRLVISKDGVNCRYCFKEKCFLFSRITDAEFGKLGLGTAMVLNEGKMRMQIDSHDFRGDDFSRFIRLVREGLTRSGYKEDADGTVFSPLKPSRGLRNLGMVIICFYWLEILLLPYYSKNPDNVDVGTVLYYGIGCERDTEKAAHYLRGESQGGERILEKSGVAALEKYRREQKDISAVDAYRIGCLYASGVGVGKDTAEAEKWFLKVCDLDDRNMRRRARFMIDRIFSE